MSPVTKTFSPYGNLMACEFLPQRKTDAGLILPDKSGNEGLPVSKGEVRTARVVAVGPECKYYKPDDIVLVRGGQFLQHDGQQYAMIPEDETFGCKNRDLEPIQDDDARLKHEAQKKLQSMIFEEASKIISGIMKATTAPRG